jgi:molybdopterin-binding protein
LHHGLLRGVAVISARNQLEGTIKSVKLGTVMAEVIAQVGQFEIVSAITRTSAESMHLEPGDRVRIVIKATEVMVAKD